MRKLLLLATLTFIAVPCFAQQIVYLKNGSALKGRVVSMQDSTLNLLTADGSLWAFPMPEVKSYSEDPTYSLSNGWSGQVMAGFGDGSVSIDASYGVYVLKVWKVGFGVGVDRLGPLDSYATVAVPVSFETRIYPIPEIFFSGYYGISMVGEGSGGPPQIIRSALGYEAKPFVASVGYEITSVLRADSQAKISAGYAF